MILSEELLLTNLTSAPETRTLYVILFPESLEDRIEALLDEVGVPGYSRAPAVVGRGPHGRHFNNPIWPGSTGEIFTVLDTTCGTELIQQLAMLNAIVQAESRGLYRLHVFAWPCQSLI
jgi:hypothetical protein